MDSLRKLRGPIRAAITRSGNLLEIEMAKEKRDQARIEVLSAILEEKEKELETADHNIKEALLLDDAPEDEYTKECEEIDTYKEKLIAYRVQVNAAFRNPVPSVYDDAVSTTGSKKRFRLPKLELQKFGGDLKDWLCFWSLFRKIHEDEEVDSEDKFQYLLQAIIPGSRARELIDSYPPTAANYPKVVESLKQRFGRDELLVEVYVRELLRLVLHNATNTKGKVTVTQLYDQLESHIRALDTLGVTSDKCAAMLYPLVESCLPEDVLRAWQRGAATANVPEENDPSKNRLTRLLQFLRSEVEGEERIRLARTGFGIKSRCEKQQKETEFTEEIPTAAGLFSGDSQPTTKTSHCIFCDKKHPSQDCFQAQKMALLEKRSCLQKRKGCFTCLRIGHMGKDCRQAVKCVICSQKHYPIMCPELIPKGAPGKKDVNVEAKASLANLSSSPEVLLKTLMVKIQSGGTSRKVRVIIDDGSHRSYILSHVAEEIGLKPVGKEPIIHALFGGSKSDPVDHQRFAVPLTSLDDSFNCTLNMLDQRTICTAIPRVPRGSWLGELKQYKIWISDVGVDCPEIEILLGADAAAKLLTGRVCHLKTGLLAVETKLGWNLMGEVPGGQRSERQALMVSNLLNTETCVSNLWKLEALGITDPAEVKEDLRAAAENHFLQTVTINDEGRYEVHLPWLKGHPQLSSNRILAERRLATATNKLVTGGNFQAYNQVFQEWLDLGVIEKVPADQVENFGVYLPHRAVIKASSTTTKVRPVFDASAHEKGSPCLNDCLEKGPNLIEDLPIIIIRFREKKVGVVADIAKAFLQLSLAIKDRDFLRFLWWEDYAKKTIVVLRHRRVVFGVSSSPFLLGAVIQFHLNHAPEQLKPAAEVLKKAFYVDNVAVSVQNEEELLQFQQNAQDLMAMGKFDLRGWEHTKLPNEKQSIGECETTLLGLVWNKCTETLRCESVVDVSECPVTKRKILSIAQKIFDPIGFTCPVTLYPKELLQQTWESKTGWDSEVSQEISTKFRNWTRELELLSKVEIPRWIIGSQSEKSTWSIHTFSDASKGAFAACVFVRASTLEGVSVQLVLAKSRVAPLKALTIPRLELLSCLIGVRLTQVVKQALAVQSEFFTIKPENFPKGTAVILDDGLYKVKTRIARTEDQDRFKLPILLPPQHVIVKYLIMEVHRENCHAGVQVLMAILRERFWVIRSRKTIRSVISKCVRCRRHEAKGLETVPAPLPLDRVRMVSVYEVTGVDLAGPLFLKGGQKAWIVLYTCAVYRALHLELVTSLSTEVFLQSLRRFISRRGRPRTIYSDNGSNFVGAENDFGRLDWKKIETYATARRIQWKFNPPTAAWWGGWWDRMVRMVKQLLRRTLGKASLNLEELSTILCDCETVINSRPLTYVSEDMMDLSPITPSVFLQDLQESGVPDIDQMDHESLNKRWQYRQKLREHFRKRFRIEYLGQLVERSGAKPDFRKVSVGDIVLVGSDNSKRMDWPLAKVMEILPGKDGHVRVVRVKLATGEYLRPVQRIYPLEIPTGDANEEIVPVPMSKVPDAEEKVAAKSSNEV
ncbi:unnamed protein product [Allacma fusca]|uniref:Pro-Pol polyprotein n=1 Tax=Allacma fusca TaxID=39272 RepID=A0A8J2Q1R5_9HEXA|nr:unnamed protein product [Allacma fusca]